MNVGSASSSSGDDLTTSSALRVLLGLSICFLAAFAFSLFIVFAALLRWFVVRNVVGRRQGHGTDQFSSGPVLIYLTIFWTATTTFLIALAYQIFNIIYVFFEHIFDFYGFYIAFLLLAFVGYAIMDYNTLIFDTVQTIWNEWFGVFLDFAYKILNTIRLIYDSIVPVFDSVVRIAYFFSTRILGIGAVCAVDDIGNVALEVGLGLVDFFEELADWIGKGLLVNKYELRPALRHFGEAFKRAGLILGCFCQDLEDVYNLLVYPLSNRHFHDSVDNAFNAALQLTVQQTGVSIRNKTRPNYSHFFQLSTDAVVQLGDTLDDWTNRTFTDIVTLIDEAIDPITNDTLQPFALPKVWCLASRPIAFLIKGTNITVSFFVNLDQLNPTNADFNPMFREWDDLGNCAQNAINGTIGMFLLDVDPNLITLGWAVGNFSVSVGETIKVVGDLVHTVLDVFVIAVQRIKNFITGEFQVIYPNGTRINLNVTGPNNNFFFALQTFYESGRIEQIVDRIELVGISLGKTFIGIYEPIAKSISALFRVVATLFRFVVQFIFYVNLIFSKSAYLRSPAMNETINDVFLAAGNLSVALGDYVGYVGIQISLIEMNDTYIFGFGGPNYEAAIAFAEYENGVLTQYAIDHGLAPWVNLTAIEFMIAQVDVNECTFTPLFYEAASVPYWGNLFCCLGLLLSDAGVDALIVTRELVTTIQNVVPPSFSAEIASLTNFTLDINQALQSTFVQFGCVVGYIDIRGDEICQDPQTFYLDISATGCPRAFQSHNRGDRLGRFVNATLNILLIPLQWSNTFLDLFNNQFQNCTNVELFAPSRSTMRNNTGSSTAQERGACVMSIVNALFVEPLFSVVDALSSFGFWINCLAEDTGDFWIEGSCLLHDLVIDLEPVFVEATLVFLDLLGFLEDGNPENLYSFIVDSAELILAILRAIITFLWTDIIIPLLKPFIDFSFSVCRLVQSVISAICFRPFKCNNICLNCCGIYGSIIATTGDPTTFVNGTFNNFTFGIPPSQPPIPTVFFSEDPSSTPTATASATPTISPSDLMMMMMMRRKLLSGDDEDETRWTENLPPPVKTRSTPRPPTPEARNEQGRREDQGRRTRPRHEGEYRYRYSRAGSGSELTPEQCLVLYPEVNCTVVDGSGSGSGSTSMFASALSYLFTGSGDDSGGEEYYERPLRENVGPVKEKRTGLLSDNYPDRSELLDEEDVFRHGMDDPGHNRYFARTLGMSQGHDHDDCNAPYFFSLENFQDLYYDIKGANNQTLYRVDVAALSALEAHVNTRRWYAESSNTTKDIVSRTGKILGGAWSAFRVAFNAFNERGLGQKFRASREGLAKRIFVDDKPNLFPFKEQKESSLFDILTRVIDLDFLRAIGKAPLSRLNEKVRVFAHAPNKYMTTRLGKAWSTESPFDNELERATREAQARRHARFGARSDAPQIADDILTNCTLLEDFILLLLQQACSAQKYYNVTSGPFTTKVNAFKAFMRDPYNYTGTPPTEGYGDYNCTYLTNFEQDFALNNEPIPFPDLSDLYDRFRRTPAGSYCNNTDDFSINCALRNALINFNIDMDKALNAVVEFLFRPSSEKGIAYYLEFLIQCNYGASIECRGNLGMGLGDALLLVYGVLIGLALFSAYVYPLPSILLGLLFFPVAPIAVFNLAYTYSPFCFPALPYCFADEFFDLTVDTFPICFTPPSCLVKSYEPPPPGGNCGNYTFYDFQTELGIVDGLQNLAILINWASPSFVEWFMTSKLTYFIYHIPFVKDNLDMYFFEGQGVPDQYVCGALFSITNVALPILLFVLFFVLFSEIYELVVEIILWYFVTLTLNIVLLYRELTGQSFAGLYFSELGHD